MDTFQATSSSRPKHWVVLIGVGLTITIGEDGVTPSLDQSLRGAVPDARAVHEYLKSTHSEADLVLLTATRSEDESLIQAIESRKSLASHENVISSFMRIIAEARAGDHVLLLYSGHGSRRKIDNAMALELVDPRTFRTQHLYGKSLRNAIRLMIRKGLDVTLVLDCCFSGSALRAGQDGELGVRYIEHDPDVDARTSLTDPWADAEPTDVVRDAGVSFARELDPEGYTILAACGPDQVARELDFEGGGHRGALSYFLVNSLLILGRRGAHISNRTLHQHIRAQFHAQVPQQTPMLYGNNGFSFFGDFSESPDPVPIVSLHRNQEDGQVVLHAGQVHGVHLGDKYALTPFNTGDIHDVLCRQTMEGTVCAVDSLESRLTLNSNDVNRILAGTTWKAVLITSVSTRKIRIQLGDNVPDKEELMLASKSCPFLTLSNSIVNDTNTKGPGDSVFRVSMDTADTYQIKTNTAKIIYTSPINKHVHDQSASGLLDTINHIANYKYLQGIENQLPSPKFESSFRLSTDANPGTDGYYHVKHNEKLQLLFENYTTHTLYLAVFIFTEQWEVRNLASDEGEDACVPVPPRGTMDDGKMELPVTMWIPPELRERGTRQTEDIIKIFVTKKSTTFPGHMLRRIGQDAQLRGKPDPVERLLRALNNDLRGADTACFDWTTRNYLIRTSV